MITCEGGSWHQSGSEVSLSSLGCSKNPREQEEVLEDSYCGPQDQGLELDIGFQIGQNFSTVLQICHDPETEATHWVHHTLYGASLDAKAPERGASNFKEGNVFYKRISASALYTIRRQKQRFSNQFGAAKSKDVFSQGFDRGHLAPDADFVYEDWQETTYYYANIAPQWKDVNRGNWKAVETAVRELAEKRAEPLDIITGTLGILRVDGKEVWLGTEGKRKKKMIPVPKVLWKVVRDPSTGDSIVLVTLNNPHYKRVTKVQVFCPDVCEDAGWAKVLDTRKEMEAGYTFCCSIKHFREKVPWLPDLWPQQDEEEDWLLNFN